MTRNKSNNRFAVEEPGQGWAFFEESGAWRRTPQPWGAPADHFPEEWGDWVAVRKPKGWLPPLPTVESRAATPSATSGGTGSDAAGGHAGSGMKIGAGHKPQPYSLSTGEYQGTGGGLSGGNEVRGKVTSPAPIRGTAPAKSAPKPAPKGKVTWNSPLKPTPSEQQLEPDMREALRDTGREKDLNISSANRPDKDPELKNALGREVDPHSEGRAVDINYVNGVHLSEVANTGGPADAELRRQVAEMQARAEQNPEVQAFISPYGGFYRNKDKRKQLRGLPPEHPDVKQHWNHVHIAVFKK